MNTLDFVSTLDNEVYEARAEYKQNKLYAHIMDRTLSLEMYKQLLVETYHFVRFTVPHLELAAGLLQESHPALAEEFAHHAKGERGHEMWALDDLEVLGVERQQVIDSEPLPHTTALIAHKYFTVKEINPMAIVGLEYTMEGETAEGGMALVNIIQETLGIGDDAMRFFIRHITVDSGHVEDDKELLNKYVVSDRDQKDVIRNARESLTLYAAMYNGLIDHVEQLVCVP
jgi:pyrroloquinoline quinone (PQQ) biosynthesis protein C